MASPSLGGRIDLDCAHCICCQCGPYRCRPRNAQGSELTMGVGIKVDKLNAWFGKTQALYDITMEAPANHATAVIGPAGCGKSTFVRCLSRMHETVPDARATGKVQIGELD